MADRLPELPGRIFDVQCNQTKIYHRTQKLRAEHLNFYKHYIFISDELQASFLEI